MDDRTAQILNRINATFYGEAADAFTEARDAPWPGWIRLLSLVDQHLADDPLSVLDVGCGHGRFASFLAEQLGRRREAIRYLGVDASAPLLARAGAVPAALGAVDYRRLDFVEEPLAVALGERRFQLAVLFGVLHHVPSSDRRRALLADCARALTPGGLLALTAWRFEAFARFRDKLLPWNEYNRNAAEPVDPENLEPGDHLLPWGEPDRESETPPRVRYCHFSDEADVAGLLGGLPLEQIAHYEADGREGRLNHYFVLRRTPGDAC